MLGLVTSSTVAGIVVTRTGRYKLIAAAGPAVSIVGLLLMHEMGAHTSSLDAGSRMLIVGVGIGLTMQNLVLIAQNAVEATYTGVVTALATLTRSVGGTVGIAILGSFFASGLTGRIADRLAPLGGLDRLAASGEIHSSSILDAANSGLAAPVREAVRLGIADALLDVFLLGVPFMAVAFVACLWLRRVELSSVAAIQVVDTVEQELADLLPLDPAHAPEALEPARA